LPSGVCRSLNIFRMAVDLLLLVPSRAPVFCGGTASFTGRVVSFWDFPCPSLRGIHAYGKVWEFLKRSDACRESRHPAFQYRDFVECSILLSIELFRGIGGFDLAMEPRGSAEFGLRLLKQGVRPYCIPEATGWRHKEPGAPEWWKQTRAAGSAHVAIGKRHSETPPELWWLAAPADWRTRMPINRGFARNKAFRALLVARVRWCERLRLPIRWNQAFQALWNYSYAAGIADQIGGWHNFLNGLQDGPAQPAIAPDAPLIDADDPAYEGSADERLPANCENGLRVAVRGIEIGALAPLIGAEPLRWSHLSRWIDETPANPGTRLASPVRDRSGYMPAALFSFELGALNRSLYVDPRYGRLKLLVCCESRPLTSVPYSCERVDRVLSPERLRREVLLQCGADVCGDADVRTTRRCSAPPPRPISVVVCTCDRPVSLRTCLNHLSRLSYPEYEVVVVDNAPRSPEVRDIVNECGFRYVREDCARNRGADEARHSIIAYTDDDTCVSPGWLQEIARAFQDANVSVVTGLALPLELETRPQELFEEYGGMRKGLLPRVFDRACAKEFETTAGSSCGVEPTWPFDARLWRR
jgi:GT2 family glycosyltransferase